MLSDLAEEVPVPQQEKTRVFSSLKANLEAVRRHLPSHLKRTHQKTAKLFDRLSHEAEAQPAGASLSTLGSFWLTYEQVQLLKYEIDHYLADEKWDS